MLLELECPLETRSTDWTPRADRFRGFGGLASFGEPKVRIWSADTRAARHPSREVGELLVFKVSNCAHRPEGHQRGSRPPMPREANEVDGGGLNAPVHYLRLLLVTLLT